MPPAPDELALGSSGVNAALRQLERERISHGHVEFNHCYGSRYRGNYPS